MDERFIYMDHAATTYLLPEVVRAMEDVLTRQYGNPSGVYQLSRRARSLMDTAREQISGLVNATDSEIFFTSGGTEADNWAIKGAAFQQPDKKHIITTAIEHSAVLETCMYMQRNGWRVDFLPVDKYGVVSPEAVADAIEEGTALVSVMAANNEIGSIQPIAEIGSICRERGVLFHTDAVQAYGSIPMDVQAMNIDMMSISAHKLYGPKGVGALYIRKGLTIGSLMHGGHQERSHRAGTENVAGIVGFGKAAELAGQGMDENAARLSALRDRLISGMLTIPGARLNGHPSKRLPNNVHICFPDVEGESMLLRLDMAGIAASAGSACSSGALEVSPVLAAIGVEDSLAQGALRLTLGMATTESDVDITIDAVTGIVARLRESVNLFRQSSEKRFV